MIIQLFYWLLLGAEACIGLPLFYLFMISVSALVAGNRSKNSGECAQKQIDFAILVPAHNEELMLGSLLQSLVLLEYPREKYSIYVVADNCSDNTATIARCVDGVQAYERFDPIQRGKGYALSWLLGKLEEQQKLHNAYVVLDADSVVEPGFLQTMEQGIQRGAQALQARNTVLNTLEAPSTVIRWIALTLMGHVRPLGRNGFGASSTLTGNGMCFTRSLLTRFPWHAHSITEDYEYYLALVEHGVRVYYASEAVVFSSMPTNFAQMRTQDVRWEAAGTGKTVLPTVLRLLKAGFRSHDLMRLEAIAELLTPPLSLLVCASLFTLLLSVLLWSPVALLLSLLLVGSLLFYVGTALFLLRPPVYAYKALLYIPGFVFWKVWVYLVLVRSKKHNGTWVRTSRTPSVG